MARIILAVVLVIIMVAIGVFFMFVQTAGNIPDNDVDRNTEQNQASDLPRSPDPVKASGSNDSDTKPSSNGTGPGSDNSLLSQ
jgi:hypothetical protein